MLAAFTDGIVRVFDIDKSMSLGKIDMGSASTLAPSLDNPVKPGEDKNNDYIVSMKILPSGNHVMTATRNGLISLISFQSWEPLGVTIHALACLNT